MQIRFTTGVILILSAALLAGCNTIDGIGADISAGARNIQDML